MKSPGPLIYNSRQHNCNKDMLLKEVKVHKDNLTWRCRKVHHVKSEEKKYTVKDVKVSIRQNSWIFDVHLSLELIQLNSFTCGHTK